MILNDRAARDLADANLLAAAADAQTAYEAEQKAIAAENKRLEAEAAAEATRLANEAEAEARALEQNAANAEWDRL
jgi:hypothetical protein